MTLFLTNTNWADATYSDGVWFLSDFSQMYGLSFHEATVLLVCILMPLLTVYFLILALLNTKYKSRKLKILTWISAAITISAPFIHLVLLNMWVAFDHVN